MVYCGQTVGRIKMKLGMQIGLSPGQTALAGIQLPAPHKRGTAAPTLEIYGRMLCLRPYNVVRVYCGQTAGWIEMKLGTEVGIGLRQIVLNRDPVPLP